MNKMRKTIVNTMFTTGSALVILAAFFILFEEDHIHTSTIFQIFAANVVINFGLLLVNKFESRYVILEYLLDISYIIVVLVAFGAIFDWFSAIPVWVLVIMAIVIYTFTIVFSMNKLRNDTKEINELLQKRRDKTG